MRTTALILLVGCSIPDFVYPPGPPVIARFEVTPFEVAAGRPTTVEWKVEGATSVMLLGAGEPRTVESEGSLPLTLDRSTAFELVASGDGGTSHARAEARVLELIEVQIVRFEVSPVLVEPEDPVRVVWHTENSTRVIVRLSTGETLIDSAPQSGTLVFRPQRDVTVQLIAEGWPSPKSAVTTVRADPDGPMITYFSVQPPIGLQGQSVALEWSVAGADRVRILEMIGTSSIALYDEETTNQNGFFALVPEAGSHTYLLEVSNEIGTVAESATAFILQQTPPQIVDFTVTPTITGPGGDLILRWSTRFADRVLLLQNGQSVAGFNPQSDSLIVTSVPTELLTYDLTAMNTLAQLQTSDQRSVVVSPDLPRIIYLSAVEASTFMQVFVAPGETCLVEWGVDNADSITIRNDLGEVLHSSTQPADAFEFEPTRDVNLVLTAENSRGRTIAYAPVRVLGPPQVIEFFANTPVARVGRPVTFHWTSAFADRADFSFTSFTVVPPNGSARQYTGFQGLAQARLALGNDRTATATTIVVSVIESASGPGETEPNDTEPFAGGPYFTFPGAVDGEVSGFDVDLFEVYPSEGDRITLGTTPAGGCAEGVALEVYELSYELGLLGPRLTIDAPNLCATAEPVTTPILASLRPPIFVAVRRPAGTSTTAIAPYTLAFSSQTGFCSDGVVDLWEDCDDTNVLSGDGCNPTCHLEGLSEVEPNDGIANLVPVDDPARAYLSHQDVDLFRFEITPAEAGQRTILLESPASGSCALDAVLTLHDANGFHLARDDNLGLGCPMIGGPAAILPAGAYQLEVRPGLGTTLPRKGRYVFSVR